MTNIYTIGDRVDPSKGTVEGRLDGILKTDSPLMKKAQGLAVKKAARRGLQNSSIAAGAGTAAMIDSALPIAQQDAETYNQYTLKDQDFHNTRGLMAIENNYDKGMQKLEMAGSLQGYQAQHVSRIQESAENTIADITNNPDISAEDKGNMIDQAKQRRDLDLGFAAGFYESLPAWQDRWSEI